MKWKVILLLVGGFALGLAIGLLILNGPGMHNPSYEAVGTSQPAIPAAGALADDFELTALNGKQIRLSDYQGKPVLINFWASWCTPCQEEEPLLEDAYRRYQPDLVILGVNYGESDDTVKAFVDQMGMTFPVLLDPDIQVSALYGIYGFPTSVFVDREGNIREIFIGSLTEDDLRQYLTAIGVKA